MQTNLLFSNKDLFKIIWPIFIEHLLSIAIGMVDSVMVSSVGESAVSGVSLVNTINVLLLNFLTALGGGGAIIMAQFLGKKDVSVAKDAGKQTFYLVTALSIVVGGIMLCFRSQILNLIFVTHKSLVILKVAFISSVKYTVTIYPIIPYRGKRTQTKITESRASTIFMIIQ